MPKALILLQRESLCKTLFDIVNSCPLGGSVVERPGRFDDHVQQKRLGAVVERGDELVQRRYELVVRLDPACRAAESPRNVGEADVGEAGPWARPSLQLGEHVHDRIATVG